MEFKLYNLKIESYEPIIEGQRLKVLIMQRKKIRSEAKQNREQILTLQERVMKLKDQETKAVKNDPGIKYKLQNMNELEVEIEDLRSRIMA